MVITDVLALLQGSSGTVQAAGGGAGGANGSGVLGLFAQILAQLQTGTAAASGEGGASGQELSGDALALLADILGDASVGADGQVILPEGITRDDLAALLETIQRESGGAALPDPLAQLLASVLNGEPLPSGDAVIQAATQQGGATPTGDGNSQPALPVVPKVASAPQQPVDQSTAAQADKAQPTTGAETRPRGEASFRPFLVRGLEPVSTAKAPAAAHSTAVPPSPETPAPAVDTPQSGSQGARAQSGSEPTTTALLKLGGNSGSAQTGGETGTQSDGGQQSGSAKLQRLENLLARAAESKQAKPNVVIENVAEDGPEVLSLRSGADHPRVLRAPATHLEFATRAPETPAQNAPPVQSTPLPSGAETAVRVGDTPSTSQTATTHASPESATPNRPTLATVGEFTVKSLRIMAASGESFMKVRLIPEHLGELHLTVRSIGETLHVHVASANAGVREALEAQLQGLREHLARDGVEVGRVVITSDTGHGASSSGGGRNSPFDENQRWPTHGAPWRALQTPTPDDGLPHRPPGGGVTHSGSLNVTV